MTKTVNETVADRETIADIVRKKRSMAAEIRANLSNVPVRRDDQLLEADSLDREADRIETAWKREKAEWEAAACSFVSDAVMSGRVAVEHVPVGNAAALREALVEARQIVVYAAHKRYGFMSSNKNGYTKVILACETLEKVDAALSEPARNCDRYEDAPSAYADFIVPWKLDGHLDDVPTLQDFANWLFAPAAEAQMPYAENGGAS